MICNYVVTTMGYQCESCKNYFTTNIERECSGFVEEKPRKETIADYVPERGGCCGRSVAESMAKLRNEV